MTHRVCTFSGALNASDVILPVAIFIYVQVLRFTTLAALLHGTPAAGVSQNAAWYTEWNYGTFAEGATYIRRGGNHVGHRPTFYFFFFLLFSPRNLSGRRLDVYHTSTHGVALVRI